jgi:DNA-binding transcriptional MerR regulator
MRLIFFWILICFSAITAFAQQPSRQEMQEQLAQAKKEAMEQVAELEKQIAEAKANKEDPGSIKEMEIYPSLADRKKFQK